MLSDEDAARLTVEAALEKPAATDRTGMWAAPRIEDLRDRVDRLQRELTELRSLRQMRDAVAQFRLDWQSGDLGPSDVEPILDRILARAEVP